NVAPGQLDFEPARVVRGAHENRLVSQLHSRLAVCKHTLDDELDLRRLVRNQRERRLRSITALAEQGLRVAFSRVTDDAVACAEDSLGRAIVLFELECGCGRIKARGKVKYVAHGRRPERVNRLRV